jgi:CBS domain-containing protein
MQVSEVMTRSVDLIDPNTQIKDAAVRMRDDNIGALPVGENDRLVGMVTDRDIAVRAVADGRAPTQTVVRDVMSEKVFCCFEDNDLTEAARLMAKHQVHRLPVLNRDKRLVGIVALADLARVSDQAAGEAVRGISEPTSMPRR